jgi:hypothetical protein
MDPRVKVSTAALDRKFQLETRLASLLSETSTAAMQASSMHEPLQKLNQQATGTAHDGLQGFETKLAAVVGAPSGFAAPPAETTTLARVTGQVATLYGQIWQVDAEPTASQSEAIVAVERDAADAMKRWDALKTTDLPALNRELRGARLPEVQIESDRHKEDAAMDEE